MPLRNIKSSGQRNSGHGTLSMDTFYRLEKEVINELESQGHKVIYEPIFPRKGSRVYCYRVLLEE
jgi:hypothetical protein